MLNVTLWDFDKIESHNIPNQAFAISQVGENKAEAMQKLVHDFTGLKYKAKGKWDGESLGSIVFSCVDSMEVRKQILESMDEGLFIETRMGVRHGQVFTIDTSRQEEKDFWLEHYVGDDVVEEKSACGSSLTIGSTANLLSSVAMWQCIHHMNKQPLAKKLTACVEPFLIQEL